MRRPDPTCVINEHSKREILREVGDKRESIANRDSL